MGGMGVNERGEDAGRIRERLSASWNGGRRSPDFREWARGTGRRDVNVWFQFSAGAVSCCQPRGFVGH